MKSDKLKIAKETVEKLLELLGIQAEVGVSEDKENALIMVQIETADPGVLIGYHGQTLNAFQLISGIMVSKKLEEWVHLVVNVGDYRQKREEVLKKMALSAAQKAHFSGELVVLTELSPAERRIVHIVLGDHPDVETYSEGEGQERRLVIKPRSNPV